MRIVFLSAVYPPEREPAAVMAGQLVNRWIEAGYPVDVFCPFPNRPEGVIREGWKRHLRQVDVSGNLRVVRCWHWLVGRRRRIWDRLLENMTFGISASAQSLLYGRPDLIVISTWPLFAVGLAILLAKLWRVPAIYYVQDLYPEAAVEAGRLRRDQWMTRFLTWVDNSYCRSSSRVVLVSESMKELFTQGRRGLASKVTVINNWLDGDEIKPMRADNTWRREHGIPPQVFLATFAGSLSLLSGADVLVRAAEYFRHRHDIFLLCVGEGALKKKMTAEAEFRGLTRIRFIPFQPRSSISAMQSASDAMILTMRPSSGAASVPSKLITYLAAGRPVVCAAPTGSECHAIIRRSNAGINVPAGDARALADGLIALAADRNAAEQMGERARRYFEEHFTADRSLREFWDLLHPFDRSMQQLSDVQKANIRYHSLLAPNYYRQPFLGPDNCVRVREILADLQQRTSGRRLLDIGCGSGFIFDVAHDLFEKLDGIDITEDMLARIERRPNVNVRVAPAEALPFPHAAFDIVTCNGVLHHLEDVGRVLAEARRVLRPGGVFYADEIPSRHFREAITSVVEEDGVSNLLRCEHAKVVGDVDRYEQLGIDQETTRNAMAQCYGKCDLDPEKLKDLLKRSGFQAVDIRYRWFLGQARIHSSWGDESARRIEEYLLSALPLTRHLFKNLMIIAS